VPSKTPRKGRKERGPGCVSSGRRGKKKKGQRCSTFPERKGGDEGERKREEEAKPSLAQGRRERGRGGEERKEALSRSSQREEKTREPAAPIASTEGKVKKRREEKRKEKGETCLVTSLISPWPGGGKKKTEKKGKRTRADHLRPSLSREKKGGQGRKGKNDYRNGEERRGGEREWCDNFSAEKVGRKRKKEKELLDCPRPLRGRVGKQKRRGGKIGDIYSAPYYQPLSLTGEGLREGEKKKKKKKRRREKRKAGFVLGVTGGKGQKERESPISIAVAPGKKKRREGGKKGKEGEGKLSTRPLGVA